MYIKLEGLHPKNERWLTPKE